MADSQQNEEPGFFAYFSQEELTNVREMQIRTHLSSAGRRPASGPELVEKCVELLGETRVLAAIKSQLSAPRYSWTAHAVIGTCPLSFCEAGGALGSFLHPLLGPFVSVWRAWRGPVLPQFFLLRGRGVDARFLYQNLSLPESAGRTYLCAP